MLVISQQYHREAYDTAAFVQVWEAENSLVLCRKVESESKYISKNLKKAWRIDMILRYPKYYEAFTCIAGECEDTCCAGWEIDIDDKSYEYYMQIPGKFGEKIRDMIKEYQSDDMYESHGFILQEGRRCPFLNKDNLCDIILELGENAICEVCTYTPRNFLEYGNAREISISPSCAEAGRLIFGSSRRVDFVEKEIAEEFPFEESKEELMAAETVKRARDTAIAILQENSLSIERRICYFLLYAKEVQECLNKNELEAVWSGQAKAWLKQKEGVLLPGDYGENYAYFQKRLESFGSMDSINEEWEHYLGQMQVLFLGEDGKQRYKDTLYGFQKYMKQRGREYEWEQLMVYYAFLFLARSVDDLNFWGKAQFCASSFLMVRDMELQRFYQNGGSFSKEDCVDVVRIYAKETEHSQENLEFLADEFLFEDIYRYEELCRQVMIEERKEGSVCFI